MERDIASTAAKNTNAKTVEQGIASTTAEGRYVRTVLQNTVSIGNKVVWRAILQTWQEKVQMQVLPSPGRWRMSTKDVGVEALKVLLQLPQIASIAKPCFLACEYKEFQVYKH